MMKKTSVRHSVDLIMTLLLPLLMAYELIGEATHEWLGISMMTALAIHHVLNRVWYAHLFKGRYGVQRAFMTALDMILAALLIAQAVSGIMMAKHTFEFLPHVGRRSMARTVHMAGAYWSFTLMNIHAGLHIAPLVRKTARRASARVQRLSLLLLPLLMLYGAYAMVKRQMPMYMFMQIEYAFFDFSEPLIFFFADVAAIMALLWACGYGIGRLFNLRKPLKKQPKA